MSDETMRVSRYRARKIGWTTAELDYPPDPEPDGHPPYGIWDTLEHRWVDKYGQPDPDGDYYACGLAVASMRARDLNHYAWTALNPEKAGCWPPLEDETGWPLAPDGRPLSNDNPDDLADLAGTQEG